MRQLDMRAGASRSTFIAVLAALAISIFIVALMFMYKTQIAEMQNREIDEKLQQMIMGVTITGDLARSIKDVEVTLQKTPADSNERQDIERTLEEKNQAMLTSLTKLR